jgi:hypothetical protein
MPQHIACHYCNGDRKVETCLGNGKIKQFDFWTEKGEPVAASELRKGGAQEVFRWICHMAEGILELQQLGLFHPDLTFLNVIETGKEKKDWAYKIIDFDYAFKVDQSSGSDRKEEPKLLAATKAIVMFWL